MLVPVLAVFARGSGSRSSGFRSEGRGPVIINLSHGSSGDYNRNFPSQFSRPSSRESLEFQPSYGKLQWGEPEQKSFQTQLWIQPQPWTPGAQKSGKGIPGFFQRPRIGGNSGPGAHSAVAVHHHPYTPGYVRLKLRNIGVVSEPALITDRSEIIHTNRLHSAIPLPGSGPGHHPLSAEALSPRFFNGPIVRAQMARLADPAWRERIGRFNSTETRRGRFYWHRDDGYDYCHFIDPWGYHWWGWYMADSFFWTRYFDGRWWWYDTGFNRWCFWNDGFWWWQDPYHMGDLYCFDDGAYVPCNSAEDQVVVTSPLNPNPQIYTSPDATRWVKVSGDSQDAFLFDTANPPTFDPVYLASGVQSVMFSDPSNGRPLEIVLRLNDGSFDMFDSYGNSYNPAVSEGGQTPPEKNGLHQPPGISATPLSE